MEKMTCFWHKFTSELSSANTSEALGFKAKGNSRVVSTQSFDEFRGFQHPTDL